MSLELVVLFFTSVVKVGYLEKSQELAVVLVQAYGLPQRATPRTRVPFGYEPNKRSPVNLEKYGLGSEALLV